ncbi:hypothetical protein LCGC14_0902290 [marine sediment metagenome]|uniref:Uncharacterized protein n=1 Tax=marine sediment metagenome TaxID=412755 RepID=A0A0F9P0X0_9ZZZZ
MTKPTFKNICGNCSGGVLEEVPLVPEVPQHTKVRCSHSGVLHKITQPGCISLPNLFLDRGYKNTEGEESYKKFLEYWPRVQEHLRQESRKDTAMYLKWYKEKKLHNPSWFKESRVSTKNLFPKCCNSQKGLRVAPAFVIFDKPCKEGHEGIWIPAPPEYKLEDIG